MEKIKLKTKEELELMVEGGKYLSEVKHKLEEKVNIGVSAWEVEELAIKLIKKSGGEPGFSRVPKYHWATCINTNEGIVHGIPTKEMVFKKGDVVSVDVGLFYKGFNTDTSFSKGLEVASDIQKFLYTGKNTLESAVSKVVAGNRIYDISKAIEKGLQEGGCNPVRLLVGHGVGRDLHEDPQIPQFSFEKREETPEIKVGAALAVEVIYTTGGGGIKYAKDGWTIVTSDDKISALYEETVVVTEKGSLVVTR